jgi:2-polyprenyl-6-methoxyphenol hydroxylase-like FAD-dependent oxidoreductase
MLNRGDYWQVAHVVAKDSAGAIRSAGLAAFRATLDQTLGLGPGRGDEITGWDQVKLLSVQVNRLERWWREGLLFIGDAAHAMSPLGGIGINLAIQDAVAAANLLAGPIRAGRVTGGHLAAVQARRIFAVKLTQWLQVTAQNRILAPALDARSTRPPLPFRLLGRHPWLRRYPARFVGLGIRRERLGREVL